jgi:hypothetical protein
MMRRLFAGVTVASGVMLVGLGLLFVVGAAGQARRLVIGAVLLGLGALVAGVGVRTYKREEAASPEQLRAELLELARRRSGEISETDVAAALGRRAEAALAELRRMVTNGECRRSAVDGTDYYTFPDLQPRLAVRRCQFCSAELPLAEELASCPSCGGLIKTEVRRVARSGDDAYGMDE